MAVSGGVEVCGSDDHLLAAEGGLPPVPAGDPHGVGGVTVQPGHGELPLRHWNPRVQVAAENRVLLCPYFRFCTTQSLLQLSEAF